MALDAILANKRKEVAARIAARPLDSVTDGLAPSDRDFDEAVRNRRPAFVLEIKPASPSEGPIRDIGTLGPAIAAYGRDADAISVLTDRVYFGGSFELLRRVRRAVTQPILCKDFVLDPYQVYEARGAGADAVLLMLSVLDDDGYRRCEAAARSLRMGILTEAHDEAEVRRAVALGARVIGLNNRNLRTLHVDLGVTPRLASLVPGSVTLIAESGVRARSDVRRLAPIVDGFLVGTALMRAAEVERETRRLIHGSTKICGLTRPDDAIRSLRLGATHGGIIFAPGSPRRVDPATARRLVEAAPLEWVGVFVNERMEVIADRAHELALAAVQLHGDEPASVIAALRERLPAGTEIWKAVPVGDRPPDHAAGAGADRIVFDTARPDRRGGTGERFDWGLVAPVADPGRDILAGGLGPDRIAAAIETGFDFFDVSSGVEEAPGIKSAAALERLFRLRRALPGRRETGR